MMLSEIRPCDACGEPHRSGSFHVIRHTSALAAPGSGIRSMLQLYGQTAQGLMLAETMAPDADEAVKAIPGATLQLCHECYGGEVCLAELAEKWAAREEADE